MELLNVKKSGGLSSQYRLLPTVDDSYEAMLRAIEETRTTLRFEMYIYTASPIGQQFRDALARAAERGVAVKVLLDAFGSVTLSDDFWERVARAGGEVRRFNPLTFRRFVFRNHRKSLICDETVAFTGGFNISTEYQGDGVQRGFRDLGLELRGELAGDLAASFDWLFERAKLPHRLFTRLRKAEGKKRIAAPEGELLLSGPGWGRNYLRAALLADVQRAQDIQIISAYFLPPRRIRRALRKAARSGRLVRLILPGKSDVPVSQMATRTLYASFLAAGVEIYEYQPQILHAKLLVFDDVVYAGSANLNLRGLHIDYELMFRLPHPDLARQAREIVQQDLLRSRRIDAQEWKTARSFWQKLMERWAFFLVARVDTYVARRQLKTLR